MVLNDLPAKKTDLKGTDQASRCPYMRKNGPKGNRSGLSVPLKVKKGDSRELIKILNSLRAEKTSHKGTETGTLLN